MHPQRPSPRISAGLPVEGIEALLGDHLQHLLLRSDRLLDQFSGGCPHQPHGAPAAAHQRQLSLPRAHSFRLGQQYRRLSFDYYLC